MNGQVSILGVDVDCVDFADTLSLIQTWVETEPKAATDAPDTKNHEPRTTNHEPSTHQICTVNPEFIIDARRDPAFARVLAEASLSVPDGIGVLWAAKLLGVRLKERVTGSDGIYRISERAAERGWRVFLLGAAPGVAEETARVLQQKYPGLHIVGTHGGSPSDTDWPSIVERLAAATPDLLFVAFGHPKQDFWIAKHRHELPAKVAIGIGGAFDFVAGVLPRAPQWMQRMGVEWLYRLILQPSRIGRMMKLPVFVLLVVKERFLARITP